MITPQLQQALEQLRILGYKPGDKVFIRAIVPKNTHIELAKRLGLTYWHKKHKKEKNKPVKGYISLKDGDFSFTDTFANTVFEDGFSQLQALNKQGYGIYLVVNPGGNTKADITECRSLFYECDTISKHEQWERLCNLEKELDKPASLVIGTDKSLHVYFVLDKSIEPGCWVELQERLIQRQESDKSIKNPDRLMRLSGFNHQRFNPNWEATDSLDTVFLSTPVEILQKSDSIFSVEEFDAVLPVVVEPQDESDFAKNKPDSFSDYSQAQNDYPNFLEIAQYLDGFDAYGRNEWATCKCPAHNGDSYDSLHINRSSGHFVCKGGCSSRDIYRESIRLAKQRGYVPEFVQLLGGESTVNAVNELDNSTVEEKNNRNDWNAPVELNGQIGKWRKPDGKGGQNEAYFEPLCDFTLKVVRELQDESGGGIEFEMKRSIDSFSKRIFIHSKELTKPEKFIDAIKERYGACIACNLSRNDLNALVYTKLSEYRGNGGKTYRLAERRGRQSDGTWVFPKRQFKPDGTPTTAEESGWVYTKTFYGSEDYIPQPFIDAYDPNALHRYLLAKQKFFGSNFAVSLMVDGFVVATIHDAAIIKQEKCFPLINAHGDAGSMKTLAAACAIGLVGYINPDEAILSRASVSLLYERLKYSGGLPTIWDDPEHDKVSQIDEIAKDLYNRIPRVVRGNTQSPQGSLGFTSNWMIGEKQNATRTRIVQLSFSTVTDSDRDAFQDLQEASRQVNRCFPDLLQIGYPREEIKNLEKDLAKYLHGAHDRAPQNLAIITYYAMQVVRLGKINFDVKQWVIDILIPQLKEVQTGLDFLSDFIEKLEILKAEALIGDWNFTTTSPRNYGDCYALHMNSIWAAMESKFSNLTYNKYVLERLLLDKGGIKNQAVKVAKDADSAKARNRNQASGGTVSPSNEFTTTRRCLLVPEKIWNEIGGTPDDQEVTSGYLELPDEVTAQNIDSERHTGNKNTEVTKLPLYVDRNEFHSISSNDSTTNNQLKHTYPGGNLVTFEKKSPQTQSQYESYELPPVGNFEVTKSVDEVTSPNSVSMTFQEGQVVQTPKGKGRFVEVKHDGWYRVSSDTWDAVFKLSEVTLVEDVVA